MNEPNHPDTAPEVAHNAHETPVEAGQRPDGSEAPQAGTERHKIHAFDLFFVCRTCGAEVTGWHQPSACGPDCDKPAHHNPDCGHLGVVEVPPTLATAPGAAT